MSIEDQKIVLNPVGGVNGEDNIVRLPLTQVDTAVNLLFERLQVLSRRGLGAPPDTDFSFITGPVVWASRVTNNAIEYSLFINSANEIFYIASGLGTGQISGSGASFGNPVFNNVSSIIGLIVFGNNAGGIITWDPSTLSNSYVIQSAAPYRYVCGQQGRAIATYNLIESQLLGPRAFAYSKPGDITTWTSVDGSAGEINIADLEDDITGLGVLHNIVVIPHRNGIHLGYSTGTLPLPYNIQSFSYASGGFWQPSTMTFTDEYMIGVGEDNVFMFDLNTITPIGNAIRAELLNNINDGTLYCGFFTRFGYDVQPARWRYHLFPLKNADDAHFVYDLKDQTWQRHSYADPYNWAWNMPSSVSIGLGSFGFTALSSANPPVANQWQTVPVEQATSISRHLGIVGEVESDFRLEDIILHYQDVNTDTDGNPISIAVTTTITTTEANNTNSVTATVSVGGVTGTGNINLWRRAQLARSATNLRISGNDFYWTMSTPAGSTFIFDQVTFLFTKQGNFRG